MEETKVLDVVENQTKIMDLLSGQELDTKCKIAIIGGEFVVLAFGYVLGRFNTLGKAWAFIKSLPTKVKSLIKKDSNKIENKDKPE